MADDPRLDEGNELSEGVKVEEGGACKGCERMGTNMLLWG